jgi:hypothetical protein
LLLPTRILAVPVILPLMMTVAATSSLTAAARAA